MQTMPITHYFNNVTVWLCHRRISINVYILINSGFPSQRLCKSPCWNVPCLFAWKKAVRHTVELLVFWRNWFFSYWNIGASRWMEYEFYVIWNYKCNSNQIKHFYKFITHFSFSFSNVHTNFGWLDVFVYSEGIISPNPILTVQQLNVSQARYTDFPNGPYLSMWTPQHA